MSFEFINGVTPKSTKEKPVIKTYESKYDSNNIERNMDIALERLRENIISKYKKWGGFNPDKFDISFKYGRKFIKVLEGTRVWGFVAIDSDSHKNILYNRGDTFKAASWNAAAKHTRGNIFDDNQDYFEWTGPNYR